MISINILFPWEKKRIIKKITPQIEEKYNRKIEEVSWNHTGDEVTSMYVYLEDDQPLYIRVDLRKYEILTISEDMSF